MNAKLWTYVGLIVAVLGVIYGSYRYGKYVEDLEWTTKTQQQVLELVEARESLRKARQDLADAQAKDISTEQQAAGETQKTITKTVTVYVETTPPECDLSRDWVLQHQNSSSPRNPEARSGADDSGARAAALPAEPGTPPSGERSGITENDVLAVDAKVHDLYYLCEFRLRRLQEYTRTQCINPEK